MLGKVDLKLIKKVSRGALTIHFKVYVDGNLEGLAGKG
jgi:hypothetical protein